LGYYQVDTQSAASYIKSVASITATGTFQTTIPTQVSGSAQNYATIPTNFQPTGTVTTVPTITPQTSCPTSVTAVLAQASSTNGTHGNATITSKARTSTGAFDFGSSSSAAAHSSGEASAVASAVSSAVSGSAGSATASTSSPVATGNGAVRVASGAGFAAIVFLVAAIAL
jgi:hypothetical protein